MFLNVYFPPTNEEKLVGFFASATYFNLSLILQRGATFLTLSGHTSEPVKRFCGEPLFLVLRNSPAFLRTSSSLLSSPISSAKSCHYAPPVTELWCNKPGVSNIHYAVAHCCYACPPPSFTQVGVYQQLKAGSHITQQVSRVSNSVRNVSSTNKSHGVTIDTPLTWCVWSVLVTASKPW